MRLALTTVLNLGSQRLKKISKLTHKISADFGIRRCTNCNLDRPNGDGQQIPFKDGLRYRWICKSCKEKRDGIKSGKKVDG